MKSSPDGKKVAVVLWNAFQQVIGPSFVDLLDFDNRTGSFSNAIRLLNGNGYDYGACFSPNNSKLYISRAHDVPANTPRPFKDTLFQFDLSNPAPSAIINSRQVVGLADSLGSIVAGPDGKLYIAVLAANHLAVVNNPNAAGAGCGFAFNGPSLGTMESLWGLPNNVDSYGLPADSACLPPRAMFAPDRLEICAGECVNFIDRTSNNPTAWEWQFDGARINQSTEQNPRNICYDTPGSFQVRLIASKPIASDELGHDTTFQTITVAPRPNVSAGTDTTICAGQVVQLQGMGDGTLQWDASADLSCTDCPRPTASPRQTTTYRLKGPQRCGVHCHRQCHGVHQTGPDRHGNPRCHHNLRWRKRATAGNRRKQLPLDPGDRIKLHRLRCPGCQSNRHHPVPSSPPRPRERATALIRCW
ncbi:MAG: hypothetical protein UZ07_CHB004000016 [Chlorobi bacterium OLB7]|nr:MAG: hypothetical protein UZ07_CHB004000016 [Chlorobi bacterium OLB7]